MASIATNLLPLYLFIVLVVTMMSLVEAKAGTKGRCDIDERVRLALRTMNSATVCYTANCAP